MAGRNCWRFVGSLGTLVTAGALLAVPAATADDRAWGCDPSRPAVAHYKDGVALDPQLAGAPVPCMSFTGSTSDSAAIGVAESGSVFWAPIGQLDRPKLTLPTPPTLPVPGLPLGAFTSGVASAQLTVVGRSRNLGAYWQRLVPDPIPLPVSTHANVIPWLSVDPETSRVWYATPITNCGVNVSWSDDEGATWGQSAVGCPTQGANALIEGPPPAGGEQPSGYPHVVYYCSNFAESPLASRSSIVCHRSLDGGRTFVYLAGSTPDSVPPRDECGGPTGFIAETRVGTVGRDGRLYFPKNVCGKGQELALAVSDDEGVSWKTTSIAQTTVQYLYPPALVADEDNNLFLAWKGAGGLPYLTISRDAGASWSEPIEVGAPGLTGIRQTAITAREPGHLSISYLGSTDGGTTFNAYITESRNALDPNPTFWSAPVNDPTQPAALGTEVPALGDRIQFLTGMIGPDGTPWAAFHCAYASLCPDIRVGIAGRLAWPSGG